MVAPRNGPDPRRYRLLAVLDPEWVALGLSILVIAFLLFVVVPG